MAGTEIQAPIFEFTGNRLCLDFVNTIHDRAGTPRELLYSYDDLIAWGLEGDILTEAEASARPIPTDHSLFYRLKDTRFG